VLHLALTPSGTGAGPALGSLLGGFGILIAGLAVLTPHRHARGPVDSPRGTRRALLYALAYGLCAASFGRLLAAAFVEVDSNVWLLALGDVMFVTLGLYAWVMFVAESQSFSAFGMHVGPPGRMLLATVMGLGPVALIALAPYTELLKGDLTFSTDRLVFSCLFATVGSALPEEILFRGYLMSSLSGRTRLWVRVAFQALAFTALRALWFLPGADLPLSQWLFHVLGVILPLGLWWGLMRDWAGGSIWPGVVSHALVAFGPTLAGRSPADY
jgi:membrane protease YdiL (CAAX protease family)